MAYARKRVTRRRRTTARRTRRRSGGYGRKAFLPKGRRTSTRRRRSTYKRRTTARTTRRYSRGVSRRRKSGVRVTMVGEGIMVRRRRRTF